MANPFLVNIWGTKEQLRTEHIFIKLCGGYFKEDQLQEDEDHTDQWLHAQRVAFFIDKDFEPIEVSFHFTPMKEPYLWVDDGNHRLAAAIYRGDKTILARVKSVDYQDSDKSKLDAS